MTVYIKLQPGTGSFMEDKDEARTTRQERILPALDRNESVILDFGDVTYTTQSYVHALIGEALNRHREVALERFEFRSCSDAVRSVIELVVDYTLGGFSDQQSP